MKERTIEEARLHDDARIHKSPTMHPYAEHPERAARFWSKVEKR